MQDFMIYEEFLDPGTGTKLTPSPGGRECLGNGTWIGYECCCDECDYLSYCFGNEEGAHEN